MCHMLNLFDGFLMVSFTQLSTTIFLVSRNLEIKSFPVKLLWVRVLYERCHVLYILSYHNFYICSDQSANSSGGSLVCIFKFTTFLSTNARILGLGCTPHNLVAWGGSIGRGTQKLLLTESYTQRCQVTQPKLWSEQQDF